MGCASPGRTIIKELFKELIKECVRTGGGGTAELKQPELWSPGVQEKKVVRALDPASSARE